MPNNLLLCAISFIVGWAIGGIIFYKITTRYEGWIDFIIAGWISILGFITILQFFPRLISK